MYHLEEWISLFIFLITAILTGHLASTLRQQARKATRREYETHMLYDLVRITTHEEDQNRQLKAAAGSLAQQDVPWSAEERISFATSIECEVDRLNRLEGSDL